MTGGARAGSPDQAGGGNLLDMTINRRLQMLVAVTACLGALVLAGGGSAVASASAAGNRPALVVRHDAVARPATATDVAKFLLHAGAAFYVFDHFIWKPYKAGDLHGFTHKFTVLKAAVAAVFVYHEVKVMAGDVKGSKLLSFLATPITKVTGELSKLKSDITGGNLAALDTVQSDFGAIKQQGNGKGINIKEIVTSL